MYMRFVQMKVELDKMAELHDFYKEIVIPSLHNVRGCIFASLIQSHEHPSECVSMTLWESQVHAEEYGSSDLYRNLIKEIRRYLADSTEWKIQLSKDLTLEFVPVSEEPLVKSYSIDEFKEDSLSTQDRSQLYVRIVAPKIHPGKLNEFRKVYSEEILPELHKIKGCRYAYLTEGGKDKGDILSVTIWDSQQAAAEYESSGLVDQLDKKLSSTFSELYQWKMGLEKDTSTRVITSEDTKVKHYQVVTGESFRSR